MLKDIIVDLIKDTWLMLPLLYVSYLIIEHFERKETDDSWFFGLQKYGPLIGAAIGLIPQCGFSIVGTLLFLNNNITIGTLLSIYIATSDEMIPVLIAHTSMYGDMFRILAIKFIVGVLVGYITDLIFPSKLLLFKDMEEEPEDEGEEYEEEPQGNSCPCCYTQYPIWISALLRSLKIYAFIVVVTFILNTLVALGGEKFLSNLLMSNTIFQPIIATLIGFIPNCVASVILTELYISKSISFASLTAGLISNAGLGIMCLIQYGATRKQLIRVVSILALTAITTGIILSII